MELIRKYFEMSPEQYQQMEKLYDLYAHWNAQINVISRKDFENFYTNHVLHSLGIACCAELVPGTRVLDVGTGGGFPGIPLAIFFPESEFVLVDSIGKKVKVVQEVVEALQLKNVQAVNDRAEKVKGRFDFVVSRAVTRMNRFIPWVRNKISPEQKNALPNGILYLKGGDLQEELSEIHYDYELFELKEFFEEAFFDTKKVVYVRMI